MPVKCDKTQVIDAHCEAVIPATVSQAPNNVIGLIEPREKLLDRYHLLLAGAASLVCPDIQGNILFRLLNLTDKPVTVCRGTTLGQFIQNDFDVTPIMLHHIPAPTSCTPPPATIPDGTQHPTITPLCSTTLPPSMEPSRPNTCHPTPTTTPSDFPDLSKSVLSPPPEKQALSELLTKYADILSQSTTSLGRTSLVQQKIDIGSISPIHQPPYRAPHSQRQEIENHVSDMLQAHLIQPSKSPCSAPVVLVKKKDGSTHFCVDYRRLNSVTRKDSYLIP